MLFLILCLLLEDTFCILFESSCDVLVKVLTDSEELFLYKYFQIHMFSKHINTELVKYAPPPYNWRLLIGRGTQLFFVCNTRTFALCSHSPCVSPPPSCAVRESQRKHEREKCVNTSRRVYTRMRNSCLLSKIAELSLLDCYWINNTLVAENWIPLPPQHFLTVYGDWRSSFVNILIIMIGLSCS